jgi:hypothetical protein
MSSKQNDKESKPRNIYDEIRADVKKKQALIPPKDAESVLAALSGQPSKDSEVLAALSGQPQPTTTKKGENNEIK